MRPQEFEKRLGVKLQEEPSLEQLVRYDSRNSYTLDENGDVIGLNVCGNGLTDEKVAFLWELPELRALNLSENQLSAVSIPAGMKNLAHLNLSENKSLDKVSFESGLPALEVLNLGECALTEIHLPEGFSAFHTACLPKNKLTRATFAGGGPGLKLLDLSGNKMEGFALPAGFEKLERLYLNDNQIKSLEWGDSLPALDTLHLRNNQLGELPEGFLESFPRLVSLYLYGNPLPDAIRGTVENNEYQNNLPFIKSYMRELGKGKVLDNECKILLVGNGNVGKSCLAKRLMHDEFEPEWNSTHGIVLERYKHQEYTFNIWDFGGQDIYHATHRLFMQSNAVYLILWDADTENRRYTPVNEHGRDNQYENYILEYWLDYAIHLGEGSPVIIVQTKTARDGKKDLPKIREAYEPRLSYLDFRHIESEEGDWDENGYNDLLTSIRRAVRRTKAKTYIPEGWAKVRQALRDKQEAGEKKLALADYLSLAEELESPMGVLENWLVKTGVVFYRKGLFHDEIILDQQWAIDAIYTIFDRQAGFYFKALHNNGSFSGKDLEGIWATKAEQEAERELFVSFMLSCEMCFETTRREEKEKWRHVPFAERTFVAPQLREAKMPNAVSDVWVGRTALHLRYWHEFLHYGVIQSFIVRTQSLAELRHIWKYGLLLREGEQLAMVEAREKEKEIRVQVTENGKELLDKIRNLLEDLQDEKGEESVSVDGNNYVLLKALEKLPQNVPSIQNQDGEYIDVAPLAIFRNKDERKVFKGSSFGRPGVELELEGLKEMLTLLIKKKNFYQRELHLATDAEKKFSLTEQIRELDAQITQCRQEMGALSSSFRELRAEAFTTFPGGVQPSAGSRSEIEQLRQEVAAMASRMGDGFSKVLTQLSAQDILLMDLLSLSEDAKENLALVFQHINEKAFSEADMAQMTEQVTAAIEEKLDTLPPEVVKSWKQLQEEPAEKADVKGAFKLTIPIIPTILAYEKEVSWSLRALAKQIWSDLKDGKVFLK